MFKEKLAARCAQETRRGPTFLTLISSLAPYLKTFVVWKKKAGKEAGIIIRIRERQLLAKVPQETRKARGSLPRIPKGPEARNA